MIASQLRRSRPSLFILLILALAVAAIGCGSSDSDKSASKDVAASGDDCRTAPSREPEQFNAPPPASAVDADETYTATLKTSEGDLTVELDADSAPNAVANFIYLAREGYYDDVPFHRIIKDFMVQTGDPTGTGTGGPGYTIKDDVVKGEYVRGTLAMANTGAPNSGGAQFFIVHQDYALPKTYPIFGTVTTGLKVLDAIASVDVETSASGEASSPTCAVILESVEIDGPDLKV